MKLKNKILIVFFILALAFSLIFVCSASEYDFISSYDFYAAFEPNQYGAYWIEEIQYLNDNETLTLTMFVINGAGPDVPNANTVYLIQPYAFKKFVDVFTEKNGDATYYDFITVVFDLKDKCYELNLPLDDFYLDWFKGSAQEPSGYLTREYFNKLYYYNDEKTYSEGYSEGITEGIKQAHQFTYDYLDEHDILNEPIAATGRLDSLEMLLADNVLAEIEAARTDTVDAAINKLEAWLRSKNLTIQDYNRDNTLDAIDRLIQANFDNAYTDWVKVGRSDAVLRLKTWLNDNNINYASFENNGLLSDIDNGLNLNVLPALEAYFQNGYNRGEDVGVNIGKTEMYNELMSCINTSFGTEYSTSDGSTYDFTVPSQAYTVAYEAGELYQINKFTDDGGISDFLADISGTVLSTFFYLGTNISFMGTTALSLISLFVIAAIVIFILKFVVKG